MSKRRLSYRQVRDLSYRVIIKSGIMLHRACPANHWSFRRIPLNSAL